MIIRKDHENTISTGTCDSEIKLKCLVVNKWMIFWRSSEKESKSKVTPFLANLAP